MRKLLGLIVPFLFVAQAAQARVFLTITKNFSEKAPIVVLSTQPATTYWQQFASTLARDLEYSGYFTVRGSQSVDPTMLDATKKKYSTDIVLTGRATGRNAAFTAEDMLDGASLFQKTYVVPESARALAHRVNDDLVQAVTGKPGIASGRIAFVSDRTGECQIYAIDPDGEDEVRLTRTDYMLHYPRWLPGNKGLLLVSYEQGWPKIIRMEGNKSITVSSEPGLNACAAVSPATGDIAVVLSKSGNPEIYRIAPDGKPARQLTTYRGIDSSPSFSPNGGSLAYVSDRDGKPQIYTMTRDGTHVRRISYLSNYATSPAWSPDGNYIAYVFMRGGFGLALYEVQSGKTVEVSPDLGSEDISWAPDSRHLVYSNIVRKPESLWVIDVFTGEKRKLTSDRSRCFSPAWTY